MNAAPPANVEVPAVSSAIKTGAAIVEEAKRSVEESVVTEEDADETKPLCKFESPVLTVSPERVPTEVKDEPVTPPPRVVAFKTDVPAI